MTETTNKCYWLSKTNWVGILTLIIAILGILPGHTVIPPEWFPWIMLLQSIMVLILRYLTNQPLNSPIQGLGSMKLWSLLLILLVLPASLLADEVAVLVDDTKPGTYLLTVGADGSVSVNPIRVVRPGGNPTPPTTPTEPTALQKTVQTIATDTLSKPGATKQTGAGLSAAYSAVSSEIKSGSISVTRPNNGDPSDAERALSLALNMVLSRNSSPEDRAAWGHFRDSISVTLTRMANNGDLTTSTQWATTLNDIHKGIDAATGVDIDVGSLQATDPSKAGILDGIDLAQIIELIKLILEILKAFKT